MDEAGGNPVPGLPREIGGYRILRVLGSGGMATVYAAQQASPRRVVALKVMKAGLVDHTEGTHGSEHRATHAHARRRATRRFQREAQILGKLRHPWIAQVFEAGTHDDGSGAAPFFVMEYIPGARTLLEYAAWKDLGLRDRLKLFAKVCSAVQHGHSSRIIHRDLKPANILVDEHGEPKIIDFGVAQAADVDLSMQTVHMDVGRLIGTIQYMSPEQVDGRPRNLTPASDVYALGVLLFRLVCMKMPYDLEALPIHEAARVICTEPPRTPSSIRAEVRGDLETIILKALEKQAQRRYPNAGSLGRDIVRFLASKPIHARRAGLLYRASLLLQRHRAAAVFSLAAIALIVASIIITAMLASRGSSLTASPANSGAGDSLQMLPPIPGAVVHPNASASSSDIVPPDRAAEPFRLAEHVNAITGLALDAARSRLYSSSLDHRVIIWDLTSRTPLHRIEDHAGAVTALALGDDGSLLISADEDGMIFVRDAQTFEQLDSRRLAHDAVNELDISPGNGLIAACADDLTIRLWDLARGDVRVLRGSSGAFSTVAFDSSGSKLAAGSAGGAVYVFDAIEGSSPIRLAGLQSRVETVVWLDDADQLAAASNDGRVCVWNIADRSLTRDYSVESAGNKAASRDPNREWIIRAAAIHPVHQVLAACVSNVEVRTWDLNDGTFIRALATNDRASCIAFERETSTIVIGEESGDIVVVEGFDG